MRKRKTKKSAPRQFNPVRTKLASLAECFEQLRNGLPATQAEYVAADRLTHSYVKSCFLMIIQRAVDINKVLIELSGLAPEMQKHHSFRAIHESGAMDRETLAFFMKALDCYEKIANPYQELAPSELYDAARLLLKHGEAYCRQIENFFSEYTPTL